MRFVFFREMICFVTFAVLVLLTLGCRLGSFLPLPAEAIPFARCRVSRDSSQGVCFPFYLDSIPNGAWVEVSKGFPRKVISQLVDSQLRRGRRIVRKIGRQTARPTPNVQASLAKMDFDLIRNSHSFAITDFNSEDCDQNIQRL